MTRQFEKEKAKVKKKKSTETFESKYKALKLLKDLCKR